MSNGDIVVPPTDLTTASIEAVNLILSELGISPLDLLLGLFSGKPKFEDTDNVITAYNQSAYWPLHALSSDLSIAAHNGAPISDSRAAIQAQFGVWKQGTLTSIQGLAGVQQGPSGPGYWTIFSLIERSWKASGDGVQAVLQFVKAIDAITIVLSQQANPTPGPPPPGPPPPPGGGPTPVPNPIPGPPLEVSPCDSGNPENDEILDLCNALQSAIAKLGSLGQPSGTSPECCANVVQAIKGVTAELTVIATALSLPGPTPPPIDLTAIVTELGQLVAAVGAIGPGPAVDLTQLVDAVRAVATAIAGGPGTDVQGIVKALAPLDAGQAQVRSAIQRWTDQGLGDPAIAQIVLS